MSTSSHRNIKRKETAENSNNKKKSRAHLPEEPDPNQIIREISNVTDITESNNINLVLFFKNILIFSNI